MAASLFSSTIATSRQNATRTFSTTSSSRASILFQLGALSNSRETQHFNKISKLQRFEHSPNLKLIKTSEIDPYPVPIERLLQNAPPTRGETKIAAVANTTAFKRAAVGPAWDSRALAVGRALLADTRRQRGRMARLVERARKREVRASRLLAEHVAALKNERQRMREEMRSAGFLILLSVGAATGLAMWTFWPAERARDSGDLGRRIAEKARASIPLPPITSAKEVVAGAGAVPVTATVTGEATVAPATVFKEEVVAKPASSWSWRSLFWRQP
ncbi:hypothetical protein CBER1_10271 [Cercospora berteroae]|uniref:Uncharacterized protein n=1 Tax=Cercospora berteroae TaxID=357750 RepID=A0A2S6BXR4_9PEZI|nr:hypothetical protein CBER1_10271 [Cercospora berteroae]